jgi:threonyl-tRNA synthetase
MDKEKLLQLRHSASHILAQAVLRHFPDAKLAIGPAIDEGFYYDFDLGEKTLNEDDLEKIEKTMAEIVKQNQKFEQFEKPVDEAIEFLEKAGQPYKVELAKEFKARGDINLGFNKMIDSKGEECFIDLCAGNHVRYSKEVKAFKLLRIAGAYWRGDEKNKMLQRIYGVAFESKLELEEYLKMLEEAKARDHRKIGQAQELFFTDEMVGKGLIMWLPNGAIIRQEVEKLAIEMENKAEYQRVITPHLGKEDLFLTSGHLPYYKDGMYPAMEMDDGVYYLKAMNCPHHHIIYRHSLRSYRDLPIRLAEYGTVYRNELSGTLAGLLRVRGMSMNDAHIYCRRDQIKIEFQKVLQMTMDYFKLFGLNDYWFRLSKWDASHTEKYINEPENWEYSQQVLREVLQESKASFVEADDEAAFYGPKVDVQFKSAIGREETLSTIQLDFIAKKRFGLSYIDESGSENNEVFVIHRAPLSTHERFSAFLIEHFAGAFPLWLSPVQVQVVAVGEDFNEYCHQLANEFKEQGIRAEVDDANETVGNKIRKAETSKVPYMLVVGEKEKSSGNLTVRKRGSRDMVEYSKDDFIAQVIKEIKTRVL